MATTMKTTKTNAAGLLQWSGAAPRWLLACGLCAALASGCKAADDEEPAEEAEETEAVEETPEPVAPTRVRTELGLRVDAQAVAHYTLATNKTTGVRMEQIHESPRREVYFPRGKTSVARFEFADGRAVEMAVQRPHRFDDGRVRFDGCVLRVNWSLDGMGYEVVPCGDFVGAGQPMALEVGDERRSDDQAVELLVYESEATERAPAGSDVVEAQTIGDGVFAGSTWHTDAGQWVFQPSSLSVEPVVQRKRR